MTEVEKVMDIEKLSDPDLNQRFSAEELETFSNTYANSDKEKETLVEISTPSESFSTEEIKDNSFLNNESNYIDSEVDKDLPSEEPKEVITNEDEWLDIMGSGNFKKKVIESGLGHETRPSRGDMVTVNYKLYLNDSVFEEKQNLTFIVGDLDVIQGLDLVVCLMEKKEKARVIIPSKLAFGKQGRKPDVPGEANIECDIELNEVQSADYDSLTLSERMQSGNQKRERGNYFYERGEYLEAIHCYERAAEYLDGIRDCSGTSKEISQEIVDVRIKVYNNMAASHLKLSAYDSALSSVELVLKVQPKNVKALFRKAKILSEKGSTEEAITCIRIAAALEPQTKVFQTELSKLINKKKKEEQSQRAMYQRMFPQSAPKKPSTVSKVFKWSMLTGGGVLALAVGMAAYRQFHFRFFNMFF